MFGMEGIASSSVVSRVMDGMLLTHGPNIRSVAAASIIAHPPILVSKIEPRNSLIDAC